MADQHIWHFKNDGTITDHVQSINYNEIARFKNGLFLDVDGNALDTSGNGYIANDVNKVGGVPVEDFYKVTDNIIDTVNSTPIPEISLPDAFIETKEYIGTILNYDVNTAYTANFDYGTISAISNTGEFVLTINALPDQIDTEDSTFKMYAEAEGMFRSPDLIITIPVNKIPVIADQTILDDNFTIYGTVNNLDATSSTLTATADNACFIENKVIKDAGESEWQSVINTNLKYNPEELEILDETSNTSLVTYDKLDVDVVLTQSDNSYSSLRTSRAEPIHFRDTISNVDPFGDASGVALYEFEGNANDTGGNYNGVLNGELSYGFVKEKFGNGAIFDKGDAYVTTGISDDITLDSFTYTGIAVLDISENNMLFFNGRNSVADEGSSDRKNGFISIQTDGTISHVAKGSSDSGQIVKYSTRTFNTGDVIHLAYRFTHPNTHEVLIDGVVVGELTITTAGYANLTDGIGYEDNLFRHKYSGDINSYSRGSRDQLRVFNRALTDSEVNDLYMKELLYGYDLTTLNLTETPSKVLVNSRADVAISIDTEVNEKQLGCKTYLDI